MIEVIDTGIAPSSAPINDCVRAGDHVWIVVVAEDPKTGDIVQGDIEVQTRQEADEKWRRATLTSVQLTSYYSGYEQIVELRERRKQQLGERFNLKEFHDQFLSYGNAPVKMIAELMQ